MRNTVDTISVIIPSYGRDQTLVNTVTALLSLADRGDELLVIDQTKQHDAGTSDFLAQAHARGDIRWIQHQPPGTVGALNRGISEAKGDIVLFLDDDIIPSSELVTAHRDVYTRDPAAWAVVGRVRQPEDDSPQAKSESKRQEKGRKKVTSGWLCDLDFSFNGTEPAWVENVMAGNLSVQRDRALTIGGFDHNFIPPVSYRFETEFAKRLVAAGGKIFFEPAASILHLRAERGGTRSHGGHLASASPLHSAGAYYFILRWGRGWERLWEIVKRPFREVRTRYHLMHPWFIPVKLVGELRALLLAVRLYRQGPRLLNTVSA